ncbi:gibberellin-regulated protein 11-like [Lycium barbarum]|uniref:gibberellin-regulated protein 11-like n=1 Tax=Lycium ferocissimum TaxID=112874 RepID=UPI002815D592|nr:gibberellin-regulated protein 11-like [Lycium ferocissimum]XP_060194820.1 gibberellin-regulated protein 11-like [Lycium barbarum]
MAFQKTFAALLIASIALVHFTHALQEVKPPAPSPQLPKPLDCGGACKYRCSETKRPNLCNRACGSCCRTCHCVPPGTSGNYEACPCYFNLTTHNNTRKCP